MEIQVGNFSQRASGVSKNKHKSSACAGEILRGKIAGKSVAQWRFGYAETLPNGKWNFTVPPHGEPL
jgi:hypothetical protein